MPFVPLSERDNKTKRVIADIQGASIGDAIRRGEERKKESDKRKKKIEAMNRT